MTIANKNWATAFARVRWASLKKKNNKNVKKYPII